MCLLEVFVAHLIEVHLVFKFSGVFVCQTFLRKYLQILML